ncbi:MAG: metallophosphoesterase [Bacillota bacterium]|nr:metallophosphoesterase [Bacillota bacterium]
MKKTILLLCVLMVFGLSLFQNQAIELSHSTSNVTITQPDLSFAVIGDVHGNNNSLQTAIYDLYNINPKMDALVLNGDTVDQGVTEQYHALKRTLFKNRSLLPQTIIKNIGNHEFFDYNIEKNTPQDVKIFISRYLEFAGEDKVYHDCWINDYHFISLGSEDGNSNTLDSIRAYISVEQQKWLKDKLSENHQSGKPIFVFLHQPFNNKPNNGWVGTDQSDAIKTILAQYPEVILFNSHTHADLTDRSVILNEPYTKVHTGAVHYTIVQHAQGQGRMREPFIKGLYIEVYGNKVVIKGRDLKQKSWIFTKLIPN